MVLLKTYNGCQTNILELMARSTVICSDSYKEMGKHAVGSPLGMKDFFQSKTSVSLKMLSTNSLQDCDNWLHSLTYGKLRYN